MSDKLLFWSMGDEAFRFLSNYHRSNFRLFVDSVDYGVVWPTVEHYYQASKAVNSEEMIWIASSPTPKEAKHRGYKCKPRSDWDDVKDVVMHGALEAKFKQNEELLNMLLLTDGFELVHFAPWGDTYWGVDKTYNGQNKLGVMLMELRHKLGGK